MKVQRHMLVAALVVAAIGASSGAGCSATISRTEPVKVIFDTDMYTDFDDAGALACLHALADAGECEILATVANTRESMSVAMCEIINAYYGRSDIPVGCVKGIGIGMDKSGKHQRLFSSTVGKWAKWVKHRNSDDAPDAADVYRKVLSAQPDKSVVICSVGFLTNLRKLMETDRELVARKVKLLVAMACSYPKGREYNAMMDAESSRIALERWPTPVLFSDFQYGVNCFAGRVLAEKGGSDNPVAHVFKSNLDACNGPGGRSAWDETAVLAAVRGIDSYFGKQRGTYRMEGDNGDDIWQPDEENGCHMRITETRPKGDVAKLIDELLCRRPQRCERPKEPIEWIDPMIGTQTGDCEGGGMMPMTGAPFGSIQWVPMTHLTEVGTVSFKGPADKEFLGFVGTRQPAICMGDWGQMSFQPRTGEVECAYDRRAVPFVYDKLFSKPWLSEIIAGGVKTRMSATSHAALFEVDFGMGENPHVVIDASRNYYHSWTDKTVRNGHLSILPDNRTVVGWNSDRLDGQHSYELPNFKGWFVMEFSRPFVAQGVYTNLFEMTGDGKSQTTSWRIAMSQDAREATADRMGGWVVFDRSDEPLRIRVGVSLISAEQAFANLYREIPETETVESLASKMKDVWRKRISPIEIETSSDDVKRIFYTGLYHASLYPREIGEYGRYYSPFDDKVHEGESYTCYSGWDTYRAEHSLLTFLAPERVDGMMRALLQAYEEGGWLPKWPNPGYTGIMVGGPAEVMLAEACAKGFRGFDVRKAYEAVKKNATEPQPNDRTCDWKDRGCFGEHPETRGGLSWYQELGYVPCDKVYESVSRTQDFAFDDTAVAVLAEAVERPDEAAAFRQRAHSWTNVWCAEKGLCLPRDAAGNWCDPKSGFGWHYTECLPETALWCVPHDIPLLAQLLGGNEVFRKRLDEYFDGIFYVPNEWQTTIHGNEPSHHVAYLYNRVGRPDLTQKRVREILTRCYSASHKGFDGNEDCGQMSAWYVLSALGFYPVEPQSGEYEIGSPIVDSAIIRIGYPYASAELRIEVRNQAPENNRVKSVTLNGRTVVGTRLRHADLVKGGRLVFEMMR